MTEQYGIDGVKTPPDEFFGMLNTFADNWNNQVKFIALQEERKAKEDKMAAAKKAKLEELRKAKAGVKIGKKKSKSSKSKSNDENENDDNDNDDDDEDAPQESMFDKMMGSLQTGDA
eukprot:CAMPEP_0168587638 /NCGR_PEP_ID=MMETSP0420-20121227/4988_1 /TAXON_ID=498008 /ORGANISM="Pessonella sp." /LENGTH=116 /DNA_ID=CAMNT_0008622937 /DNA_START=416 /DNA_END=763 /DNA_ORIENTATION=+